MSIPVIVCGYGDCGHGATHIVFLDELSGRCAHGCTGHPICACCLMHYGGFSAVREITPEDVAKVAAEMATSVPADFRIVTS